MKKKKKKAKKEDDGEGAGDDAAAADDGGLGTSFLAVDCEHVTHKHLTDWLECIADLGMKKKKKKKAPKEGDDEFAAKLAALDIDKEGGDEAEPVQEGDMYVYILYRPCVSVVLLAHVASFEWMVCSGQLSVDTLTRCIQEIGNWCLEP